MKLFSKSRSSHGVASIIGGLFLILIIISAYAFFAMSTNETNNLQSTIRAMNAADDNRRQENIVLSNVFLAHAPDGTYLHAPDGTYYLTLNISNQGQKMVNITYIGIFEEGSNNPYTFTKVRLSPGVVGLVIFPEQSLKQDLNVADITGTYHIKAVSEEGNIFIANYPFVSQSTTSISLVQTNGGQGASVTISGSGFTRDSLISIEYDQNPVTIGSIEPFTVGGMASPTISSTPPTSAQVNVAFTDSATLTGVTADAGGTVTYTLYSGTYPSGTQVSNPSVVAVINGVVPNSSSFTVTSAGSYYFTTSYSGDANNNPILLPIFTDSSGLFSTMFTVPIPSAVGAHNVKATDGKLFFASTTYTRIQSKLTLNQTSGAINTNIRIQISGSGYLPNSPVTITMNGNTWTVHTDQYGSINSPIIITSNSPGQETLTAIDRVYNIGSTTFTFS